MDLILLLLCSISWSLYGLPSLHNILGNMCIVIVCFSVRDDRNFEINLTLPIQSFFSTWPKSQDKNLNILRIKIAFKMKWKAFFFIKLPPYSNFLKNFRKYKLVWAVFLWLSIYIYLTYFEIFSGFCSLWKSGSDCFVGSTWRFLEICNFVQISYFLYLCRVAVF